VVSAVVLLLMAVIALAVSTILIAREQTRTQAANEQLIDEQARTRAAYEAEAQQRARAEENFHQARRAVDFFIEIGEQELADRPLVRRKLLEAALAYYQDFIKQHDDDPSIQAELIASHVRVAGILTELGARAGAEAALEEARRLEAQLPRPTRPDFSRGPWPPFGPPFNSSMAFLGQKSVQDELKLSDEQRKLAAQLGIRRRDSFGELRSFKPEEWQTRFESLAEQEKTVLDSLSPEQARRLKQIMLQQRGAEALGDPETADALGLTAEQREKIRALQDEARKAMWGRRPGGMHGEPGKSINDRLLGLLTPEQQAKWRELNGEPFMGEIRWPGFGGGFRHPGPGKP
jgi:hypothetical protein